MKLRRQLLLVSLLTLALPWAGCEYIREMENTLRQGQAAALQATARAVAARLANDPRAQALISHTAPAEGRPLYAHLLTISPIVDGYDDDWRSLELDEQRLVSADEQFQASLLVGKSEKNLFLFCRVRDASPRYYTPLQGVIGSDHVSLRLKPPGEPASRFNIYTAAPGKVTVTRANGKREHRIKGVWREWRGGYQLEVRLPLAWTRAQLGLTFVNASSQGIRSLSNFAPEAVPPPVVSRHPTLDAALAVFTADNGLRLRLASPQNWLIAEAGELSRQAPVYTLERDKVLARLYRLALGEQTFPPLGDPTRTGRFTSAEVSSALTGEAATGWYQSRGQQVARVAVPVKVAGIPIAAVIAEQSTNTLHAMTNSAFSRLVSYSLAAFAVAGLGLLAYASWLSWRIRRLSQAAEGAVDANGRINQRFPRSRSSDEIGDLSRRYSDLLERLRQYNNYLETLASKLSHELRTPLAVVRSSLDNLEHEKLSHQASTYSERAKEGAQRLSHILTAMSAASRVEQSIHSAELEPVNLRTLLQELTAAYADAYPQVNWHFMPDDGCHKLQAAPELLVQMLDKLADNAADFCPAGQGIHIHLQEQAQHLIIQVSNPGPPLPKHMRGQLFDSLVSIRDSHSDGHHLGLGLYIVRLIADFHGGCVEADNAMEGSGAVFTVRLPIST